ncbi:alpha/beta hydrolase domain-containing protein [Novosphingobium sp. KACC 22771]|uniref:alpha/beta hydrolase domain-containing protein n=1 Tax=Novosphingobium sp. KACC 22771 TaxID=3025670 RepID=UPI002365BBD6|nr:alpha/beta hydrolase domain-containing protein [Novosphingobium sp. KACC 22771]WDF74993.1 alpha/beta hydrolase domain-containing protein [Novosphingobium sp. KACC 22771]
MDVVSKHLAPLFWRWCIALCLAGPMAARAQSTPPANTLPMPVAIRVPDSGALPLSSALRKGTEYADLKRAGYVEEEYFLSGVAPAISAQGQILAQAPYVTRFLIRKPADPKHFNGTVIIEPFSWFGERAAGWILTKDYLLRRGFAFVGYTLNINTPANDPKFPPPPPGVTDESRNQYGAIVNFDFMRRFDYARYAPLGSYYDPQKFKRGGLPDPFLPQAQGIGAELAMLMKANRSDGPAAGLDVRRVYVNSWAVQAQVWFDYLDQGRHQQWRMPDGRPLIDAYMTGKFSYGEVAGPALRLPSRLPPDVPFITVYSQSETVHDAMEHIALPPDSDTPMLRYYEVMGTSHLRAADLGTGEIEPWPNQRGKPDDPRCQFIYDEPAELPFSALLDAMDLWVREHRPMPRAPRVPRTADGVVRDMRSGNPTGGVRPPWITVPAAEYWTDFETGCGVVYDSKRPYSAARLRKLYGTYANYARRFAAATIEAVRAGVILPEDAPHLSPVAKPEDFERNRPTPSP